MDYEHLKYTKYVESTRKRLNEVMDTYSAMIEALVEAEQDINPFLSPDEASAAAKARVMRHANS